MENLAKLLKLSHLMLWFQEVRACRYHFMQQLFIRIMVMAMKSMQKIFLHIQVSKHFLKDISKSILIRKSAVTMVSASGVQSRWMGHANLIHWLYVILNLSEWRMLFQLHLKDSLHYSYHQARLPSASIQVTNGIISQIWLMTKLSLLSNSNA